MEQHKKPTRVFVIFVVSATIVLLLGSYLLNTLVFHAAETKASFFLSPATFTAKPNTTISLQAKANVGSVVSITGAQVELTFNNNLLKFDKVTALAPWKTIKTLTVPGKLVWYLAPEVGAQVETQGEISFGQLDLAAGVEGSVTISPSPSNTIIGVTDPGQTPTLYNAVSSVQDAVGQISATTQSQTDFSLKSEQPTDTQDRNNAYTSERIISTDVVTFPTNAVVLCRLQYPGTLEIHFGTSKALGQTTLSSSQTSQHIVKISGLNQGSRYFYQVIARQKSDSQVTGALKSFDTPKISTKQADFSQSSMKIFPQKTQSQASVFIALRDSEGSALPDQKPELRLDQGEAKISAVVGNSGYYEASLNVTSPNLQRVAVSAYVGGEKFGQGTVILDPAYKEASATVNPSEFVLAFGSQTLAVLFALLIGLFFFGVLFFKLARSK